ncbi:MAG: siderophore-interacting protein [Brucellaceae bacterium]|nr:siderophore-interacting protein [Brucellaceae bacterium]
MSQHSTTLHSYAHIRLNNGSAYLPPIIDRLNSYEAHYDLHEEQHAFHYSFGHIELKSNTDGYLVTLRASENVGLSRLKDLAAVAIKLYTKEEAPEILWEGDQAGEQPLPQFRQMTVVSAHYYTPHMLRIRFSGEDLTRFSLFGAMHVRLLLPTEDVPHPVWPIMGPNGLPFWPDEENRPAARAYTIRNLNIIEGWMEIDFYIHETEGLACQWAKLAKSGDKIGLMGPVGRPLRQAKQYLIGADMTGLPAVGRMLEEFAPDVTGHVLIAVDTQADIQPLAHPEGVTIDWIINSDQQAAATELTDRLCALPWPEGNDSFGWFAAEADHAKIMRDYWRKQLGKSRDQTLVAGYWQKDSTGFMAG